MIWLMAESELEGGKFSGGHEEGDCVLFWKEHPSWQAQEKEEYRAAFFILSSFEASKIGLFDWLAWRMVIQLPAPPFNY